MKSYAELLDILFNINVQNGVKLGLDNVLKLNQALHDPAHAFPSIHVAGTNGKGSVCTKIATVLQLSGLRVGIYTSPHISCFRERVRINGIMITEDDACRLLNEILELKDSLNIPATFFEITTILAFKYFAEQQVDIGVIEVGLGGSLDATNIINPKLSVITSISLEHTEILGSTIEAIAKEKAGIIKPNTPVIIGPHVPKEIIEEIAVSNNCPCTVITGSFADYHAENEAIAAAALEFLQAPAWAIARGIRALPPCRLEMLFPHQLSLPESILPPETVILDVAHNPDGFTHMLEAIKRIFPKTPLRFVLGISKNKDLQGCLNVIKEAATYFHLIQAPNNKGIDVDTVATELHKLGVPLSKIMREPSIGAGVLHAVEEAAQKKELVVICGTFFIMADVRHILGIQETRDPYDLNEQRLLQRC